MRRLCLLFAAGSVLATCVADARTPIRDAVIGQVADEDGKPIAGAEVTARHQSNPGGVSISRSVHTDGQGHYRIDLRQPPGVWTVHAKAELMVGGSHMVLDMTPDNDAPFAGNLGAVRNFHMRFVEQSAADPYGTGAMVVVAAAIGDYTPLEDVTLILHPAGGGAPIERKLRSTGEGWVLTGLRPQTYRVTASHNGRPMMISAALNPQRDYDWRSVYVSGFERTGPGIYQMRIEVRSP